MICSVCRAECAAKKSKRSGVWDAGLLREEYYIRLSGVLYWLANWLVLPSKLETYRSHESNGQE
jgi:hypothetical protein